MSQTGTVRTIADRGVQAFILVLLFGLLFAATRVAANLHGGMGNIAAVGFLLLGGTLMSELVENIGIPHLTGYLAAGILAGPYVLELIDHNTVQNVTQINALALALIALEGGAELKLETVRKGARSLAWSSLLQTSGVLVGMGLVFFSLRRFIPFLAALEPTAVVGVSLLWGVMGITRSPSAVLGILSQTRANGPVASFTLTFVMFSDVVVVIVLATCLTIAKPLIEPGATISMRAFHELGREILGSVALGTTLGLVLAGYIKFVGRQMLLVFLALGFGLSEVMRYLQYDALLAFMVAGFVVRNLSSQGDKFLGEIHKMGAVVYIIFFATAGAHLDIPLLRTLWPIAVTLAVTRALFTWGFGRLASHLANDPPVVKRLGISGLISQAGLALGIAAVVARNFPSFGDGFRQLAIATVALNEMFGPILFKFALDRAGETSSLPATRRPSIAPTGPHS